MCRHTFRLRDLGGVNLTKNSTVHLDQVFIVFRPSKAIGANEFQGTDRNTISLRVETMNLLVRLEPGEKHVMYMENANNPFPTMYPGDTVDASTAYRATTYSSALALTPDVDGNEDYWARTYRPIRDLPVLKGHEGDLSEITIELIFPMLLADTRAVFQEIPNYRILSVYCEFSVRLDC